MKKYGNINSFFNRNRKTLYIILSIVMISVITLTVAYAALSSTLNINGNAEVVAANWNVHLDNVVLSNRSVTTAAPTITDARTATFSTTLSKPGDFYEFTIDIVNNGSIDAMIDSVTKTPELNASQSKYLNYIVEYQNGEPITTKQLVEKNSFVRLKVKVEFRKDITASDLPTSSETLNLSFKVNYVQSDETGTNITNNGIEKKLYEIVSGDLNTVGSEICISDECFYLIKNNGSTITILSKMNITNDIIPKQSSSAITTRYSSSNYWGSVSNGAYVYDSNSTLYNYVESYKAYLESQGVKIKEARLIKSDELEFLGCSKSSNSCLGAPSWVYATQYWTGAASYGNFVWIVNNSGGFSYTNSDNSQIYGVRPIIDLIIDDDRTLVRVEKGDGTNIGDQICIGDECFYTISSDSDSITMLAEMNITTDIIPNQSANASFTKYSSSNYWGSVSNGAYVYDSNSTLYNYVESYKTYLESQGAEIEEARLIKVEELESIGCSKSSYSCSSAPSWVYATQYWTGAASYSNYVWIVNNSGGFSNTNSDNSQVYGIRPVITILKSIL